MVTAVRRFDVHLVALNPARGHEIRKTRPCVVVSPDEMNRHIRTAIVAPMTSARRNYPTRVNVSFRSRQGQVALDQIRTVDTSRLVGHLGRLPDREARIVADTLQRMFSFD